jgi:hypothetical protein
MAGAAPAAAQTKEECARAANEAQTLRDARKFRDARAALSTCASAECPTLVTDACRPWLAQLDAEMPTVIFDVRDDRGRDLVAVRVLVDGTPLTTRLTGTAVALDPGEHALRFEADGFEPAEEHLVVRMKEKDRVVGLQLRLRAHATSPPPRPGGSWRTPVAVGLGVLATGAAAGGIYFVAQANDASRAAADLRRGIGSSSGCFDVQSNPCSELGDHVDTQHRAAGVAAGLLVTAGALALGALAVWLLWPGEAPSSAGNIAF